MAKKVITILLYIVAAVLLILAIWAGPQPPAREGRSAVEAPSATPPSVRPAAA